MGQVQWDFSSRAGRAEQSALEPQEEGVQPVAVVGSHQRQARGELDVLVEPPRPTQKPEVEGCLLEPKQHQNLQSEATPEQQCHKEGEPGQCLPANSQNGQNERRTQGVQLVAVDGRYVAALAAADGDFEADVELVRVEQSVKTDGQPELSAAGFLYFEIVDLLAVYFDRDLAAVEAPQNHRGRQLYRKHVVRPEEHFQLIVISAGRAFRALSGYVEMMGRAKTLAQLSVDYEVLLTEYAVVIHLHQTTILGGALRTTSLYQRFNSKLTSLQ